MAKRRYALVTIKSDGTITMLEQATRPGYEQLRGVVGGLIETIPHLKGNWSCEGKSLRISDAYCNEEGLIHDLPHNAKATELWLSKLGKGPFWYEPNLHGDVAVIATIAD